MNLAASNIAWCEENDDDMYCFLNANGFTGLEIAPTKLFGNTPYDHIEDACLFSNRLKEQFGLSICSMQSIWYGVANNIFDSIEDRDFLLNYTKSAIRFAEALGCKNIVFGCPKNRHIHKNIQNAEAIAHDFFSQLGEYAKLHNTIIAIEANPSCYNTNFINTTKQAFDFCKKTNSDGLKVNVDVGTMIYNNEDEKVLLDNVKFINHIHISEPFLKKIANDRSIHYSILNLPYNNYYSIEMNNENSVSDVKDSILYLKELANGSRIR